MAGKGWQRTRRLVRPRLLSEKKDTLIVTTFTGLESTLCCKVELPLGRTKLIISKGVASSV